jgi:ubiquinol-cytochrome c reductase cytochrome c subunit
MRRRSVLRPLLVAVLLAAAGQAFLAPGSRAGRLAQTDQLREGSELYARSCASCHGVSGEGTTQGPSLLGVGEASVDFMLSTGRMPLADPATPATRKDPAFSAAQIRAVVSYVASLAPGGEPIPSVDPARGDLSQGMELYLANCAACHATAATGDSIGGNQIAPGLGRATPLQIAEAIRTGPGAMPRFGETTIPQEGLDSIARYLEWLRGADNPGGLGVQRVGPVAEGFIAVVIGLGLLLVVIRLTGSTR